MHFSKLLGIRAFEYLKMFYLLINGEVLFLNNLNFFCMRIFQKVRDIGETLPKLCELLLYIAATYYIVPTYIREN